MIKLTSKYGSVYVRPDAVVLVGTLEPNYNRAVKSHVQLSNGQSFECYETADKIAERLCLGKPATAPTSGGDFRHDIETPSPEAIEKAVKEQRETKAYKCDECGETYKSILDTEKGIDGKRWCRKCLEKEDVAMCSMCGESLRIDSTIKERNDGDVWCDTCWKDEERDNAEREEGGGV